MYFLKGELPEFLNGKGELQRKRLRTTVLHSDHTNTVYDTNGIDVVNSVNFKEPFIGIY